MKFKSFFSRIGNSWRQSRAQSRRRPRLSLTPAVVGLEELEARNLPSTLPPVTVDTQSTSGIGNVSNLLGLPAPPLSNGGYVNGLNTLGIGLSPQVVVDPMNPEKLAVVSSSGLGGYTLLASGDGGYTWTTVVTPGSAPSTLPTAMPILGTSGNLVDPTVTPTAYVQNTDATLTFDRSDQIYIVMSEHNAAYTSGSIILQKFNFSSADPAGISQTITNKVLYKWNGADAAYNPTIAVDNNDPFYTDPTTHAVQIDTLATMHTVTGEPANPYEGAMVPKAVYVAWNTVNNAPSSPDPRFPGTAADFNGVVETGGGGFPFNPNMIKVMGSGDGGFQFTTPESANDPIKAGSITVSPSSDYGIQSSSPQIVFTQGSASGSVPGGEMAIVWDNLTLRVAANGAETGGGFIIDTSMPDQGVASELAAEAFVTAGTGGGVSDALAPPMGVTAAGSIPVTTMFPITVNVPDPNFVLDDASVSLALAAPHMNEISIVLEAPDGTEVTLLNNYTDATGMDKNINGVRATGLADMPNLGINTTSTTTYSAGQVDDTVFDQQASRAINDLNATAPFGSYFRPDDLGAESFPGEPGVGLNVLQGWTPNGNPITGAHALNGTWTLLITDFVHETVPPPFLEFLDNWSLNLTAYISTAHFGADAQIPDLNTLTDIKSPNNDVPGAPNDVYKNKPAASPVTGIGPTFSVAVDNTLGSFSPFQGRIYIAATTPDDLINAENPDGTLIPDDTAVQLVFSDDGGATWNGTGGLSLGAALPAGPLSVPIGVGFTPQTSPTIRFSDDATNDGTEGTRPEFMPTISVDPTTGTLVVTYMDARYDAARARVATSIQTSIDGGVTWSASTFLNPATTATDAISGTADTVGPIPTNIGAANGTGAGAAATLGIGNRQGLAVYDGKVYAFWSGNLNSSGTTSGTPPVNQGAYVIFTTSATIAAGPRVVSGDSGPVTQVGSTTTYDDTFASDGTRQITGFQIQLDRPVDPATVNPSSLQISYRSPSSPAGQPATNLTSQITGVTPLNEDTTPSLPSITIGNATVLEAAGAVAMFPVLLSAPQTTSITLTVSAGDITARKGINYEAPGVTVTIPAGAQSAFVDVPILEDPAVTGNLTFVVNLSGPPVGALNPPFEIHGSSAIGTIIDAESPRDLSISDGIALKGMAGTGMLFQVILNQTYFQDVTVHYSTANGTAVAGIDYIATSGYVTIPAGTNTATIVVPIVNNVAFNPNLTFTVTLDTPPIGIAISRAQGTGTIVSDTTLFPLTINVGDAMVVKGQSGFTNIYFPVVVSIPQTTDVVATFTTANDSGAAGTDYVATSGTVLIPAGQATATITVQVIGDTLQEGTRDFFVNLTSVSDNISLGRSQAKGTIIDSNFDPAITIGNATAEALSAGNTSIFFPVYFSIPSTQAVTFNYATLNGSAAAGVDYTATSGTITVPAGQTSTTITVQVLPDQQIANDKTFFVNIFGATGATLADQQATGTIVDSPLALSIGNASIDNPNTGKAALLFTVYLNGPTANPVMVNYATAKATFATNPAIAGTDYVATMGTLTFAPGQISATITVMVDGTLTQAPDNLVFFVNLSHAINANILLAQGVGTIVDDNAVPTLTVGNVVVQDGDVGAPITPPFTEPDNALVPVYLSYPVAQAVTVNYTLANGVGVDGAVAGTDYVSAPGTVTINAGSSVGTITVPIIPQNSFEEPNLDFTVNLGKVTTTRPGTALPNAVVAPSPPAPAAKVNYGQGTVTIVHDGVTINVGDPTILNPATGKTVVMVFPVYLSGPRSVNVTFTWATANDTAVAGIDYTAVPATMGMITAGTTMTNLTVAIIGAPTTSTPDNSTTDFFVNLTMISGADPRSTVSKLQGKGIIFHTDGGSASPALPVEVSIGNVTQLEGNVGMTAFMFPVTINQSATATVNFTVGAPGDTAVAGVDYVATMGGTLTFTAGGPQEMFITVLVNANVIDNQTSPTTSGNRFFTVNLTMPSMGTIISPAYGSGIGTIVDDDALTATISDPTVLKPQSGTVSEVFTILLSNLSPNPVTLTASTANLTAIAPLDYKTITNRIITIPKNTLSATFTVTVNGNTLQEGNTQYLVNIPQAGATGVSVAKPTGTGTIVDQNTIALTIGDVSGVDGPAGTTDMFVFPVYLNSATTNTVTVNFATQDYTAMSTATNPDYIPTSGTLSFAPGTTVGFITVTVNGMAMTEPNKQFTVNLSGSLGAGLLKPVGIGTIINDNLLPALTIGDATVPKGPSGTTAAMVFPVYLSFPVTENITVPYSTADDTATAAEGDYVPVTSGTVVIPQGQTSAFITVTVNGDNNPEGNEDFFVNLSVPMTGTTVNATLARPTAKGLIVDTDKLPTVNVGDVILDKTASLPTNVVFPVLLSNPSPNAVSVHFTTINGTAIAGTNYLPTSGTLNIPAGAVMAGITVTVLGNSFQEGNKFFYVNLTNSVGATIAKPFGVGTIIDDTSEFGASQYLVSVAPQSAVGTYSYAVGPFVSDRIQTDLPTIEPVPGTNATVYAPPPSQVQLGVPTLAATGVAPLAHTDSTLTISGVPSSLVIRDLTVNLSIAYPLADHLLIDLIAPDGFTNVWLTATNPDPLTVTPAPGTSALNDNYFNTTFDSQAQESIAAWNAVPPFDGSFSPAISATAETLFAPDFLFTPTPMVTSPLSVFDGVSPDGTWTLRVYAADPLTGASDPIAAPAGLLQNWSLSVQTGILNATGSTGNYMDQNSSGFTVSQTRSPEDIFAQPQQVSGVPVQQLPNPVTLPDGTTAIATASAPFQLPYVSTSLPLIIPGPYVQPLGFYPSPNPGSLAPVPNPVPLNLPIPVATAGTSVTPGTLDSTINIAGIPTGQVITDLTVSVSIDHTQVSNLVLTLIAPDGTQVVLSNRNPVQLPTTTTLLEYLPGANFDDVTFDDNAPERTVDGVLVPATLTAPAGAALPNFEAPYSGSFQPQSPLSALNGKSLNGTWTLQIQNMVPGAVGLLNTGSLLGWSLQARNGEVLDTNAASVDVGFDQLINPATFTTANILSIMGPLGPVPLKDPTTGKSTLTITPLLPNGTPDTSLNPAPEHLFRISFPAQSESGNYSVQVGPNPVNGAYVASTTGNKLDINQNAGLPALEGQDQSTTTTIPITTATNAAPNAEPAVTLVPGGPLALMPLKVPSDFVIHGVKVTVNITATFDQALQAVLYAPDGTAVTLFTDVGSGPVNGQSGFQNTTFDDAAATPIQEGVTPFNTPPGSYEPQLPLSVLDGMGSEGTWYLGILDAATVKVGGTTVLNSPGKILNWSLTLLESPSTNTGLGEPVADQFTAGFQVFIADPTASQATTQWTPVGPAAVGTSPSNPTLNAGRITALAVDPSDPSGNTVYAGAASGGVWKTTDFLTNSPQGPNWIPLTDFGPTFSLNIGAIVVIPQNSNPLQAIIIAATGEGNTTSPGVGFLRSMDGGQTWQVLDSSNNENAATGGVSAITSSTRDHEFVGTTAYQLLADVPNPAEFPTSDVILYAAMGDTPTNSEDLPSSNKGGIYRSTDMGLQWTLVQAGNATDVQLAAGSAGASGNLQILYGAIEGLGVVFTSDAPVATSMTLLPTPSNAPQQDNLIENDANYTTVQIVPVASPASTPSGAPGSVTPEGRITLAVPKLTSSPLLNSFYEGWVYAVVATPLTNGDQLNGLYMSKDFGHTWTQVQIPVLVKTGPNGAGKVLVDPTNDYTQPQDDPLAASTVVPDSVPFAQANYDISLTVDPSNPNIVYLGGEDYPASLDLSGLIQVNTTNVSDPYNLVPYSNSLNDGGTTMVNSTGAAVKWEPTAPAKDLVFGLADPYTLPPFATTNPSIEQYTGENPITDTGGYVNLQRNPEDPFITNSTVREEGIGQPTFGPIATGFTNTGEGASWIPYEAIGGLNGDQAFFDILAVTDPLSGETRLIVATSLGVYTQVTNPTATVLSGTADDAEPLLITGIGSATDPNGSRNGDIQVTQFFDGSVQPSELAAELAGSLFYGTARENGPLSSNGNVLENGNLSYTGPTGDATGIATDQTGSGTEYQYLSPTFFVQASATGFFIPVITTPVGGLPSDFFQVTPPGGTAFSATNGLVTGGSNPAANTGLWPTPDSPAGSSFVEPPGGAEFAVNPVDGNGIAMSSPGVPGQAGTSGWVFLTTTGGKNWFPIAEPTDLDSTYAQAMAFGAPTPSDPPGSLDNFIYAGTVGGHVYLTTTGGGVGVPWKNITANLDGSAIQEIVPDPQRGSDDLYAVTLNGVYYMANSAAAAPTWVNITGNLFSPTLTRPLFDNGTQPNTLDDLAGGKTYLNSLAVDWRYAIPNSFGNPTGPTHPVLYVAGEAGVFRSLDNGTTWTPYPDTADGAAVNGGYLPDAHVTALSLSLGNINPSSGLPLDQGPNNQGTAFNMLVATTYGRGQFEIRLNNRALVNGVPLSTYLIGTEKVEGPYVVTAGLAETSGSSVSAIDVTFSGAVDPSTFTLSTIKQIIGPAGNSITPLAVVDISVGGAGGDLHNMYQIQFPPQTTVGVYTVTFGPNISDFGGNEMDQNRNGINGEAAGDSFTGVFFFGASPNPAVAPPPVQEVVTRILNNGQWWVGTPNGNNAMTFTQFGQWAVDSPTLTWVNVHVGDFTGNGTEDIVGMVAQTGQWWVGISDGNHFTNELWATWAPYTATFQWQDVVFGDFTGDGKLDIAGRESGNGKWWVAVSTGHSFVTSFWTAWTPNTPGVFQWTNVLVGDFTGDGKDDIAGRVLQTGQWWVSVSNGKTFSTQFWGAWTADVPGTFDWVNVMVGDFNGDGKDDIVGRVLESGQWFVNFSTGSSFATKFWDQWSPGITWVDVQVGDVNGDGKDDILGRAQNSGGYWVSKSVGTSGQTSLWAAWGTDALGNINWEMDTLLVDLNGDGKQDLIAWDQALGEWWVSLSTGAAFGPRTQWASFPGSPSLTLVDTTTGHVS